MKHIVIESLYKIYGGIVETVALENFNEEFEKGEVVAIAGPSGSGKTSLLSCIGGVSRPTSGKILVDGINIAKLK
ncbi:MAG: ATP-binding cassette domain-containing protein [Candidatus Heimdallarchaeaceae archaeon]